jgi:hypothetical protein
MCAAVTLVSAGIPCKRDGTESSPLHQLHRCIGDGAEQRRSGAAEHRRGRKGGTGVTWMSRANPLIKCAKAEESLGGGDLPCDAEAEWCTSSAKGCPLPPTSSLSFAGWRRRRNADEAFLYSKGLRRNVPFSV